MIFTSVICILNEVSVFRPAEMYCKYITRIKYNKCGGEVVRTEVAMNITDKQLESVLVFGWVTGFLKIYLGSLRRMENALFNGQWILCPALPLDFKV